jgi:hypothetical protein
MFGSAAANLRPLDKGQDVASIVKARAPGRADATVNIPCFDKPKLR